MSQGPWQQKGGRLQDEEISKTVLGGIEDVKGFMACYYCERLSRLLPEVCDELVWSWFAEDLLDLHGRHVVSLSGSPRGEAE